jgi:hypothetical protein
MAADGEKVVVDLRRSRAVDHGDGGMSASVTGTETARRSRGATDSMTVRRGDDGRGG